MLGLRLICISTRGPWRLHYCMFSAKPLLEPMLTKINWTFRNKIQWNLSQNTIIFISEKMFLSKCHPCFSGLYVLTHRCRVTHICVRNLTIIGSDNGLSPGQRQAIIWINAGILLIEPFWNNLQWNINHNSNIFIQENALENVICEMASMLSRPQCVKTHAEWRHRRHSSFSDRPFKVNFPWVLCCITNPPTELEIYFCCLVRYSRLLNWKLWQPS